MKENPNSFATFVEDLFSDLGTVQCRSMFGGYGVYFRGRMFALIADDRLYMKVDTSLKEEYKSAGCEPFIYHSSRKPIQMSYWSLPEEALEQPALAVHWAQKSLKAAASAAKKSVKKSAKKTGNVRIKKEDWAGGPRKKQGKAKKKEAVKKKRAILTKKKNS